MRDTAIVLTLALVLFASPALGREVIATPLKAGARDHASLISREEGDLCHGCSDEYHWTIGGWMTGNEVYRVYCEPSVCSACEGGWKPISVTMYLYWDEANSCALSVSAEIERAGGRGAPCDDPSETLVASQVITVGPFDPPGLWAVTVPLPEDAQTITDPFFATFRFHNTCGQLPDIVTSDGPCESCRSWNDWGSGWNDLCPYGFPGNLALFTTLECQGVTPVLSMTWGAIKAMYIPKEG